MTSDNEPNPIILSFRPLLNEQLQAFAQLLAPKLEVAADLIAEAVVGLFHFREERRSLFPVVFLSDDIEALQAEVRGRNPLRFGSGRLERGAVRRALKCCAPLVSGKQWAIYLLLGKDSLEFGVFRTEQSPLVPTAFERLRARRDPHSRVIGVTQLGENIVELRSGSGEFRYIDLGGVDGHTRNPTHFIRNFLRAVTRDVAPDLKESYEAFYYRLGVDLLRGAHGTLLAVVPAGRPIPSLLADGIILDSPISFASLIASYDTSAAEEPSLGLMAYGELLRGMARMDGISILSSNGDICGYNSFIHDPALDRPPLAISGGARRRAYEVLAAHVGKSLVGALYLSQDGSTASKIELTTARVS